MNVAIILAAGESRRMRDARAGRDTPKQLLPFGGKTMLECVLDAFQSPRIHKIIAVLGYRADEIAAKIKSSRSDNLKFVTNSKYEQGMFTSVQAGLRALPPDTTLVMIALCDQPRLLPATVEKLLDEFEKKNCRILIPLFEGHQGHPLLVRAEYAREILALDENLTLKHFLATHASDIVRVPVTDPGTVIDIDDPEDYRKALKES